MGTEVGLRERKKARTKKTLEEVALRLFATRGFDAVTVDEIAAEADVAPRTFFRYFPTKEDVVLAHFVDRLRAFEEALDVRPQAEDAPTAIRNAFSDVARDYEREKEGLLVRAGLIASTPALRARNLELQARWEGLLVEAIAPRLGVDPLDPRARLLAACAVSAMRVSLETWVHEGGGSSLPERLNVALGWIERGFGS